MKNKYILAIFFLGMAVTIIGGLFKIMHWPMASAILFVGLTSEVVAIILFVAKMMQNSDFKKFLEK